MKKVAIIGAGYGGLRAIEHLVEHEEFELYLFDTHSYHYLQTEAYGYIAGRFDLHDVALDVRNWVDGFEYPPFFIQEEVTYIDTANIAAEMADVIQRHTKSIGALAQEISIYLIDASDTILPGMSPYIIKQTNQRLQDLGVHIQPMPLLKRSMLTSYILKAVRSWSIPL